MSLDELDVFIIYLFMMYTTYNYNLFKEVTEKIILFCLNFIFIKHFLIKNNN